MHSSSKPISFTYEWIYSIRIRKYFRETHDARFEAITPRTKTDPKPREIATKYGSGLID